MIRHLSLKQRLLLLVLPSIVLVWLGAIMLVYHGTRKEINELFDAHLAQAASLLAAQSMHELGEIHGEDMPMLSHFSTSVAFQVWEIESENKMELRLHSANSPEFPLSRSEQDGFSDVVINGQAWRVFSFWNKPNEIYLIHVAELASAREQAANMVAYNLLLPLLLSLPLLAIMLWVAVMRGLRPLDKLAHDVEQREPDNLAVLDASSAPREVLPLIERLNRLFMRIDAFMQRERRFTADAAHELRTPMAAIKSQAQVAQAASSAAERIHAIDSAILGCDRATHLIEQLLTLARVDALDAGGAEHCRLKEIAAGEIALIAPAALDKGVRIELLEENEISVRGNPELLRILMRNLIDNAVRHTPPGTTVQVSICRESGTACLSVSDDGPGIPKQEMDRVSERFYRPVGTQASGSGLGLSIVRRIAEMHDASVRFMQAGNGRGLRVTVTFGGHETELR